MSQIRVQQFDSGFYIEVLNGSSKGLFVQELTAKISSICALLILESVILMPATFILKVLTAMDGRYGLKNKRAWGIRPETMNGSGLELKTVWECGVCTSRAALRRMISHVVDEGE